MLVKTMQMIRKSLTALCVSAWACAAVEMADEAYALQLQAELNGQRPPRERSRLGAKPPPRTTRSAGRANGAVKYTYSDVSLAAPVGRAHARGITCSSGHGSVKGIY